MKVDLQCRGYICFHYPSCVQKALNYVRNEIRIFYCRTIIFKKLFCETTCKKNVIACVNDINNRNICFNFMPKIQIFSQLPLAFSLYFKLTGSKYLQSQLHSKFKSYKDLHLSSNVCNSSSEWAILCRVCAALSPLADCTAGKAGSFSIIDGDGTVDGETKKLYVILCFVGSSRVVISSAV